MKKILVFIGNFGSGKTELALNFALRAAESGRTELIDLDMVNTYFRLSEYRLLVEAAGIRLVSPNYVMTNVESLSLPAEVSSAFHMDWDTVIFDAGGDPAGATALGRFHSDFAELASGQLEVLHVVNARRPMSGTADKLLALQSEMEKNARLRVTGLINNTNLQTETTPEELEYGYEVLRSVSEKTGIPVVYTTGEQSLLDAFLSGEHDARYVGTPLAIRFRMRRDWASYIGALRDDSKYESKN